MLFITLGISSGPEKKGKLPWLWVYYSAPMDYAKDNIIRALGTYEGRWTGSGVNTDNELRDNSFEFEYSRMAKRVGEQMLKLKLITSFRVAT